jgi:hypothetical protein
VLATEQFGDMVKAVVDVRRRLMAIGGDPVRSLVRAIVDELVAR